MKKFYLSTAIPYVNSAPHCGFALELIQSDVLAREHRLLGENTFFLTGTDENSLKNVQAAEKEGINVKELVDKNAKKFYELKKFLNLSFDDFIRTTEKRHIKGAQKLWQDCQKDIYKKKYRGLYCVGCEEFYKESELENGFCPEHKTKPELIEEENYFFRLSKYQEKLKKIIEKEKIKIIPATRKNEVLSFINQGLEDICISRLAKRARGWGIDVPGDKSQKIWVWFDALPNYINALGYGKDSQKFQKFWQENQNKLHIIGKGILRFHAIYWPAMLLSAKLVLPNIIFVHGYLTSGGQKMSKSLGNVIDPFVLVKKYGTDAVRYFFLREIPPSEDGDFTFEKFETRYNSDLANGLGNLVARVVTLATKLKVKSEKLKVTVKNPKLNKIIDNTWKNYQKALEEFKFNEALISIWELISFCDRYIEKERPWQESKRQKETIANLLFALTNIADMLQPFLPETSKKIIKQLKTKESKPLFPRI
ncbi:class I tRNA ligase family protein [Patescibacteria group bacterium]|nr:class I tRNA ligase family protein [Patescibacteria group bacterium]MBU4480748.1 class I tRNA ligase family protein [Patescibacteria group bacterium]